MKPQEPYLQKTGDLYYDTRHLEIKIEESFVLFKGEEIKVFNAIDQHGNESGNCRKAERAELLLRAWHDVQN